MLPGDWGTVGPGCLAQLLLGRKASDGGRIHRFLRPRSRAGRLREKGTARFGDDEKPFLAGLSNTGWFRARVNHSCLRHTVATVHQHGRAALAFSRKGAPPKERRRKAGQSERSRREGHAVQARLVKTLRRSAMLKTAPLT
jgi:hypothetical protein